MNEEKDYLTLTDDDENDEFEEEHVLPELNGTLSKWTNYIHGWQDRFIVLKDGTLSYYKSENDTAFGCRGAVSLNRAAITPHEFDECRFDVSVNDCLWYLRGQSAEERQQWIDSLEMHRQSDSGYGSENSLRRHGSMLSLTSGTSLSTASTSSFKRGRGLREKLAEMETFRDILCRQVDTLQGYFDSCSSAVDHTSSIHDVDTDDIDDIDDFDSPKTNRSGAFPDEDQPTKESDVVHILKQHGAHAIDFKGEAFTFKATTAGILATLSHCIELMQTREEAWKKKIEREVEKRRKVEEAYKTAIHDKPKPIVVGGPDYEEGPHCAINEDEFFDAVDSALDKMEKEIEDKVKNTKSAVLTKKPALTSLDPNHPLYTLINDVVNDHIDSLSITLSETEGDDPTSWCLLVEEGDMRVYKRELEEDGMVVDPLKAVTSITGVTGHEICHYFWNPEVRMDWEGTLETTDIVEWVSSDTLVSYQVHKRVWPASQRDALFWSHIRHCPSDSDEGPDLWIVCNYSTETPQAQVNQKCVRVKFNIAMVCETLITPPEEGKEITRDHLKTKIQYTANVNPGGWAPASVLRAVYKREYPKFVKRFTQYVKDTTESKPIMF